MHDSPAKLYGKIIIGAGIRRIAAALAQGKPIPADRSALGVTAAMLSPARFTAAPADKAEVH